MNDQSDTNEIKRKGISSLLFNGKLSVVYLFSIINGAVLVFSSTDFHDKNTICCSMIAYSCLSCSLTLQGGYFLDLKRIVSKHLEAESKK